MIIIDRFLECWAFNLNFIFFKSDHKSVTAIKDTTCSRCSDTPVEEEDEQEEEVEGVEEGGGGRQEEEKEEEEDHQKQERKEGMTAGVSPP